jgi:DNA invertase Pin-like site-specific DNA recombinase
VAGGAVLTRRRRSGHAKPRPDLRNPLREPLGERPVVLGVRTRHREHDCHLPCLTSAYHSHTPPPGARYGNRLQPSPLLPSGADARGQPAPPGREDQGLGCPKQVRAGQSLNLRDPGVCAFRGKNAREGALSLFLAATDSGRVKPGDYLVLENLDRLSRDDVFTKALPLVQQIIGRGVSIVTLDPERVYSPKTVKEIGLLLEMLLSLFLANEESRKKSERRSQSWANKRAAGSKKLTARCPQWLQPSADRTTFVPIPERVEVVRAVFRMAADGAGYVVIRPSSRLQRP